MDFPGSSIGKEFACSVGDLGSIPGRPGIFPWIGKIPWRRKQIPTPVFWPEEFSGSPDSEKYACNVGDLGSIPGLGRYPEEGHGNPFQYSVLENPHGQRSLAGCSPWGCRVGHNLTTEQQSQYFKGSLYQWLWRILLSSFLFKVFTGFVISRVICPGGSGGKESACSVRNQGSIPWLGRYPEEGHGNPLQYFCLENPSGQRSLVGYSPWGHKESVTTEWQSTCYQ